LRLVTFTIALVFTIGLAILTGLDIARNGLTGVSVMALIVLVLFATGILGALWQSPRGPRR
jgi:hypothetical protein